MAIASDHRRRIYRALPASRFHASAARLPRHCPAHHQSLRARCGHYADGAEITPAAQMRGGGAAQGNVAAAPRNAMVAAKDWLVSGQARSHDGFPWNPGFRGAGDGVLRGVAGGECREGSGGMIEQLSPLVGMHSGDCIAFMASQPENSFDSIVCDPPYHLTSIVKRFGGENAAPVIAGKSGVYARSSAGFMGKAWDGGDIAFQIATWQAALRVLKPGGYLLAFGGTRTAHRMVCAIEDAGFEIRDQLAWLYASGFPKSQNVSKFIDKAAGERGHDASMFNVAGIGKRNGGSIFRSDHRDYAIPKGITESAKQWEGWGTALKPAIEPICLARKPLSEKTIAANVLKWGTGGVNIDACRVPTDDNIYLHGNGAESGKSKGIYGDKGGSLTRKTAGQELGRWPANLLLSLPENTYELRSDATVEQRRELFGWLSENA